jgi:hypothetical protein
VRAFLTDPVVSAYLRADKVKSSEDDLVESAGGAPGRILAASMLRDAKSQAQRLLDALGANDRAAIYRAAFSQGASRARGGFTDSLNALAVLLHERVRTAVRTGNDSMASGAARALELVERAKEQATSNVNPQLLTAGLLRDMAALMR